MVHGIPPPLMPRSGAWLCAPVSPAGTPTIVFQDSALSGPLAIATADVTTSRRAMAPSATKTGDGRFRIVEFLLFGRVHGVQMPSYDEDLRGPTDLRPEVHQTKVPPPWNLSVKRWIEQSRYPPSRNIGAEGPAGRLREG